MSPPLYGITWEILVLRLALLRENSVQTFNISMKPYYQPYRYKFFLFFLKLIFKFDNAELLHVAFLP